MCVYDVLCRATFKRYRDRYREKIKSVSPSSALLKKITVSRSCRGREGGGKGGREGGKEGRRGD